MSVVRTHSPCACKICSEFLLSLKQQWHQLKYLRLHGFSSLVMKWRLVVFPSHGVPVDRGNDNWLIKYEKPGDAEAPEKVSWEH